jgi:hypothetical protein
LFGAISTAVSGPTSKYPARSSPLVRAISAARDSLDGGSDDDQGIGGRKRANLVPTHANGIAFSRSADRVLNIVYLPPKRATKGGFYPEGVNGPINTSGS